MDWNLIYKAVEGNIDADEIQKLWSKKAAIEGYIRNMSFSTSSVVLCSKDRQDPREKIKKDAYMVRVLELMNETLEELSPGDRQVWMWRYYDFMVLEEIGQLLTNEHKDSAYWRKKAERTLHRIAERLSESFSFAQK
jgi:DNA-directed RNA polymerase specialized sigma subunit